jgi:hypothetical protein
VSVPGELQHGELAAFERSSQAVEFEGLTDTEFVLGSAAPHEYDLALGYYSVHTSPDALRDAEAHIASIKAPCSRRPSVDRSLGDIQTPGVIFLGGCNCRSVLEHPPTVYAAKGVECRIQPRR